VVACCLCLVFCPSCPLLPRGHRAKQSHCALPAPPLHLRPGCFPYAPLPRTALVVGHTARHSAPTTNLAAAEAMREPQQAMPAAHEQQAAVQRAAMAAEKQMAVKMAAVHTAQQLQDAEEPAPERSERGDSSADSVAVDLLPPKDGIKGGQAKELQSSVEAHMLKSTPLNPEHLLYLKP